MFQTRARMICLLAACAVFLPLLSLSGTPLSQARLLPDNVLFSASDGTVDENWSEFRDFYKYNILGRIDANTLEVTRFYEDETATILKPLSWSPQGNLLAVLRVESTSSSLRDLVDICILTSLGKLQTCFRDRPPSFRSLLIHRIEEEYVVTWSADGHRAYFVAEEVSQNQVTRLLVEADTTTGLTLRTLYQTEPEECGYDCPTISWTDNLSYVVDGAANRSRAERIPAKLVNLETKETLDLRTIGGLEVFVICRHFSPSGKFLTAVERDPSSDSFEMANLIVFNKQGVIIQAVNVAAYGTTHVECPTWTADESSFFLNMEPSAGPPRYILLYQLEQDVLTEYVQFDDFWVFPPIRLSSDERFLAFGSFPIPTMSEGVTEGSQITVVDSQKEVMHLGAPFDQAQWPLWTPLIDISE